MPFHRISKDQVLLDLELGDSVSEFQRCSCLSIPHAGITGVHASLVWGQGVDLNSGPQALRQLSHLLAQDFPFLPEVL